MKKYTKTLVAMLCSVAMLLSISVPYVRAEEVLDEGDIPQTGINYLGLWIGEEYFPDETFRQYLRDKVDTDHNNHLSDSELEAVTKIDLTGYTGTIEKKYYNSDSSDTNDTKTVAAKDIESVKGIEVFEKLEVFIFNDRNKDDAATSTLSLIFEPITDATAGVFPEDYLNKTMKSLKYVSCYNSKVNEVKVEDCSSLEYLNVSDNTDIQRLNVTKNPALEYLYCSNTHITGESDTLDLSKNTELRVLDCSWKAVDAENKPVNGGYLKVLDLTKNIKLEYLDCSAQKDLKSLKLAETPTDTTTYLTSNALEYVDCHKCALTTLDLKNGAALQWLDCSGQEGSAFAGLDVSKNTKLEYLDCSENTNLATLTLKDSAEDSSNRDYLLRTLYCNDTKLSKLDLSNFIRLEDLDCSNTELTSLDLNNNSALQSLVCEKANEYDTTTVPATKITNYKASKITDLKLNGLLHGKAGLALNDIYGQVFADTLTRVIDPNFLTTYPDASTRAIKAEKNIDNLDIYYTGNALDIMNVIVKDITEEATLKYTDEDGGGQTRKITYTNVDIDESGIETAKLQPAEKKGSYTLARCTHLFRDAYHEDVIYKEPVIIYVNGALQNLYDEQGEPVGADRINEVSDTNPAVTEKKNQCIVYTDITASYAVTADGKPSTGKVIVGITDSTTMPTVTNSKINETSATGTTAKIKNGMITIKAGTAKGVCYLWVIDTGDAGAYECCPINVLMAPKKLQLRSSKDIAELSKNIVRMTGEKFEVIVAGFSDATMSDETRTQDCTYSCTVPDEMSAYVTIYRPEEYAATPEGIAEGYKVPENYTVGDGFIIIAKGVANNKDTKVPITFTCNQNKQKFKLNLTISPASIVDPTPVTP